MRQQKETKLVRVRKEAAGEVHLYTVRQKRCWALIIADLQKFINLNINWDDKEEISKYVPLINGAIYEVEIFPELVISKGHSYASILESLKKLTEVWVYGTDKNSPGLSYFILFHKYRVENNRYFVSLTVDSLRWLMTLQKGNFMTFHINSFLKLSTTYSMDLFLYLSENFNRNEKQWNVTLEDFKNRVGCPKSYDFKDIKDRVLLPALEEYNRTKALFTFRCEAGYTEECLRNRSRGRKKIDLLTFTVMQQNEI